MTLEEIDKYLNIPYQTIYKWQKLSEGSSDYGNWRRRVLHLLSRLTPTEYFNIIGYKVKCKLFEDEIIFINFLHLSGDYFITSNNSDQQIELLRIEKNQLQSFLNIVKKEYQKQFDEIDITIKFEDIVIKSHRNIFTDIIYTYDKEWIQNLQKKKGLI